MQRQRLARRALAPALLGLTLLIGLTACSGSETNGSSSGSTSAASGSAPRDARAGTASSGGTTQRQSVATAAVPVAPRSRIYKGQLTISSRQVATVADAAISLADRVGAEIDGDHREGGQDPSADVTLRIAPSAYFSTLDRLARLPGATERNRSSTVNDVSLRVADLSARVSTQQTTIAQIRQLITRTTNLQAIVQLQENLAQQQVQLESLQAEQRQLRDQVALATITLHVRYQPPKAVAQPQRHSGFTTGLVGGWHGLGATVRVVLTVFGALLPFLVVALLLSAPAYLVFRRRRGRGRPVAAE